MSIYIDRLTMLTDRERRSLIYFFASLDSDTQIEIVETQNDIINRKRAELNKDSRGEFFLATLVLAVKEYKTAQLRKKRRTATPAEIAEVDRQRMEHMKRKLNQVK